MGYILSIIIRFNVQSLPDLANWNLLIEHCVLLTYSLTKSLLSGTTNLLTLIFSYRMFLFLLYVFNSMSIFSKDLIIYYASGHILFIEIYVKSSFIIPVLSP